ncbi:unnamed protein product [Auanema sp. JU1783]|nr:unnamed protein product [Auanema sp. JU1783]
MMVASSRVSPSPSQMAAGSSSETATSTAEDVHVPSQSCQDALSTLIEAVSSSSTSPTNTSDSSSVASDFANLFAAVQQSSKSPVVSDQMDVSSPQPAPSSAGSDGGQANAQDFSNRPDFFGVKAEFPIVKQENSPMDSLIASAALDPSSFWQLLQQHNDFLNLQLVQRAQQHQQVQLQKLQQTSHDRKRSTPSTFQFCELCQKDVHSSKLPCHIRQYHVGQPMFQCPACDFASTYSKNNVKSHMVSLHGLAGDPVSYMEKYAPQVERFMKICFPHVRGRGMSVRGRGRHVQNRLSPRGGSPQPKMCKTIPSLVNFPVVPMKSANAHSSLDGRESGTDKPNVTRSHDDFLLMAQPSSHSLLTGNPSFSYLTPALISGTLTNINNNKITINEILKESMLEASSDDEIFEAQCINMDQVPLDCPTTLSYYSDGQEDESRSASSSDFPDHLMSLVYELEIGPSSSNHHEIFFDKLKSRYAEELLKSCNLKAEFLAEQNWWFQTLPENNSQAPTSLLNAAQISEVSKVRNELSSSSCYQIPSFEVLYALNKMDISILPVGLVKKVRTIAPNEFDSRVIKLFVQEYPQTLTTDEERFIVELAQIERLEDKLAIMIGVGKFDERVAAAEKSFKRLLECLLIARKAYQNQNFMEIGKFVKQRLNVISQASSKMKPFPLSKLGELCATPDGKDGSKVFDKVVEFLHNNGNCTELFELVEPLKAASLTNFNQIASLIRSFCELARRCERESRNSPNAHENIFQAGAKFYKQYDRLYKLYHKMKRDFSFAISYMCEDTTPGYPYPLRFLNDTAEFLERLRSAMVPSVSSATADVTLPKIEESE